MSESRVYLLDSTGNPLAELLVGDSEGGWFTGKVVSQNFPSEVEKALAWYDEIVRHQMLSYLDEATSAVERFSLKVRFPDGSMHPLYSLHMGQPNGVSFRT